MTGIIKSFDTVEWYVIASFILVIGTACTGICHILIGNPIFDCADWFWIATMIGVGAICIYAISQDHKRRRMKQHESK